MKSVRSTVVVIVFALAAIASSCATTQKNPTPADQAATRRATADVIERLTKGAQIADGIVRDLAESQLAPDLKIAIGCDGMKAIGRDNPSPAAQQQCGPVPSRKDSPVQRAIDAAENLTTCASRQNTVAVVIDAFTPFWQRLEKSGDPKWALAGAGLRLIVMPIQTSCGG